MRGVPAGVRCMTELPPPPEPGIDPDEGLELHLAVTFYAEDQTWARHYSALSVLALIPAKYVPREPDHPDVTLRDRGPLTGTERSIMRSLEVALLEDLLKRLQGGQLVATGFPPGNIEPVRLPPTWWRFAKIDLETGSAEANGVRLSGLLVFPAKCWDVAANAADTTKSVGLASTSEQPGVPLVRQPLATEDGTRETAPTIAGERRLQEWLVGRMRASPDRSPGKPAVRQEARMAGHSFSTRGFERAWATAVRTAGTPAWSAPGRKSPRRIEAPK